MRLLKRGMLMLCVVISYNAAPGWIEEDCQKGITPACWESATTLFSRYYFLKSDSEKQAVLGNVIKILEKECLSNQYDAACYNLGQAAQEYKIKSLHRKHMKSLGSPNENLDTTTQKSKCENGEFPYCYLYGYNTFDVLKTPPIMKSNEAYKDYHYQGCITSKLKERCDRYLAILPGDEKLRLRYKERELEVRRILKLP